VEGDEVSVYYDPLLSKVIAYGETRDVATARLAAALREYPILGVRTNLPYLLRILDHPRFRNGDLDTMFLEAEAATLPEGEPIAW
jgi:acetyl/propionyl-CoA carboxylase alpha subunit